MTFGGNSTWGGPGVSAANISSVIANNSNSKIVYPGDNLVTAYAWLKSSDRDTQMGALAKTARRTLILYAGVYPLTATLTLDTEFVDIVGVGNPVITFPENTENADLVVQTAANVCLSGFTVSEETATSDTLVINIAPTTGTAATTSGSYASAESQLSKSGIHLLADMGDKVYLSGGSVTAGWYTVTAKTTDTLLLAEPVIASAGDVAYKIVSSQNFYTDLTSIGGGDKGRIYFENDSGGFWHNCKAYNNYQWRIHTSKAQICTMVDCTAYGSYGFGGDFAGAYLGGNYYNCIVIGDGGFLGCGGYVDTGAEAAGKFFNCVVTGRHGFAGQGGIFSGEAYRCRVGGGKAFGAYQNDTYPGRFSGYCEDCVVEDTTTLSTGIGSFGFGKGTTGKTGYKSYGTMSGTLRRCRWGSVSKYRTGLSGEPVAKLDTHFTGRIIDCHPYIATPCAASASISAFDSGQTYDNTGASGGIVLTLPHTYPGLKYTFIVKAAQALQLQPHEVSLTAITYTHATATFSHADPGKFAGLRVGDVITVSAGDNLTPGTCTIATINATFNSMTVTGLTSTGDNTNSALSYADIMTIARTPQTAGLYIQSSTANDRITLECDVLGTWLDRDNIGTWTVEGA